MAVNPQELSFFGARQRVIAEIAQRQGMTVKDVLGLLKSPGTFMYRGVAEVEVMVQFEPDANSEFTPEQMELLEKWMTEEIKELDNEPTKA
jgi:hypothetical protein